MDLNFLKNLSFDDTNINQDFISKLKKLSQLKVVDQIDCGFIDINHPKNEDKLCIKLEMQGDEVSLKVFAKSNNNLAPIPLDPHLYKNIDIFHENFSANDIFHFDQLRDYYVLDSKVISISIDQSKLKSLIFYLAENKILFINDNDFIYCDDIKKIYYFKLEAKKIHQESIKIWGHFESSDQLKKINLWDITSIHHSGFFIHADYICFFSNHTGHCVISLLKETGPQQILVNELSQLIFYHRKFFQDDYIEIPDYHHIKKNFIDPVPLLFIKSMKSKKKTNQLEASIWFDYNYFQIPSNKISIKSYNIPLSFHSTANQTILNFRDETIELVYEEYFEKLPSVIFKQKTKFYQFGEENVLDFIYDLLDNNWKVWAEEKKVEPIDEFNIMIKPSETDWFETGLQIGNRIWTALEIIQMLKKKNFFISVGINGIGILPQEWYKKFNELFDLGEKIPPIYAEKVKNILQNNLDENIKIYFSEKFTSLCDKIKSLKNKSISNTPTGFKADLRSYQKEGLFWIKTLDEISIGGCLADDMGLGKTVQILAFLEYKRSIGCKFCNLIVAPKSLLAQWESQSHLFAPEIRVKIVRSNDISSLAKLMNCHDLLIINYSLLRININLFENKYFDVLIVDEAQFIKSNLSQINTAIKLIDTRFRLALTGTPIENKIDDLMSIFEFLNPGMFSSKVLSIISSDDIETQKKFFEGIRPFILRRLKKDVLSELPLKTENVIYLEMEESQQDEYQKHLQFYKDKLTESINRDSFNKDRFYFLEGLLRLKQICDHPYIVNHNLKHIEDSIKTSHFIDIIDKITSQTNDKIIVFSQFTSFLKIIAHYFLELNIPFIYLDGQTQNRDEIINQFQQDNTKKIFLISIKAGGFGLNLTCANHCFIMDPWWNRAVENQAIDRIYRFGQNKSVFIYRYIIKDSIEEKILKMGLDKNEILDMIHLANDDYLDNFSVEDFKDFFS